MSEELDRIRRRVEALLAKADSTSYPEEAESLVAKAHQLMAEYAIAHADLGGEDPGRMGSIEISVDGRWAGPRQSLLGGIAAANRCATCITRRRGSRKGVMSVFGDRSDLDTVRLLFTATEPQLLARTGAAQHPEREWFAARAAPSQMASVTREWRKSFAYGFAARIAERLRAANRAATAASPDPRAADVALVDAHDRADAFMREQLGALRADRARRSVRGDAYAQGAAAADSASLASGAIAGGRRALRGG